MAPVTPPHRPQQRAVVYIVCALVPLWILTCTMLLKGSGLCCYFNPLKVGPPAYEILVQGTQGRHHARIRRDEILSIQLRPLARVPYQVSIEALIQEGGQERPWPVSFESLHGGVFRLVAPIDELPMTQTRSTLHLRFVVKPQGGSIQSLRAMTDCSDEQTKESIPLVVDIL